MFIRFVVGADGEDHRALTGVITEARMLREAGLLHAYEIDWLEEQFDWFNEHVPVPPYSKSDWPRDVAAWFKNDQATAEAISRMWEFVHLLEEQGKNVRVLKVKAPGYICYEDEFQVVVSEF